MCRRTGGSSRIKTATLTGTITEQVWLRGGKKGTRKWREEWKEDGKRSENKAHQTVILFNKEMKKRVSAHE